VLINPLVSPAPAVKLTPLDTAVAPAPTTGTLAGTLSGSAFIPLQVLEKTVEPPPSILGAATGGVLKQTDLAPLAGGYKDSNLLVYEDKALLFGSSKSQGTSLLTSKFDKQLFAKADALKTRDDGKSRTSSGSSGGQASQGQSKTQPVVKLTPLYIPAPTMCEVADFRVR
jgi:hypothetical protein